MGEAIEERGFLSVSFEKASYRTAEEVTSKMWPEDMKQRFNVEQDPFMLVINTDFQEFDPSQHRWAIIWFSGTQNTPDHAYRVFSRIIRIIRSGDNRMTLAD